VIFFEGTYTFTFSGSIENATPRYDYNQIMYRLDLHDPRLALPVAVYQLRDEHGARDYLLGEGVEKTKKWDSVESIPFYAVEPQRAHSDLVPIYADKGRAIKLTGKRPNPSAEPLFYALSSSGSDSDNSCIVSLYEYRHTDTGRYLYSTKAQLHQKGWVCTENPLCRVWKTQPETVILDSKARPAVGH
jgi:hypothetical protein